MDEPILLSGLFGDDSIRHVINKLIAASNASNDMLVDNLTAFISYLLSENQRFVMRHHIPQYDPNYRDEEMQMIL